MEKPIAVALSGGVDSSVAATLLREEGYDVFGITMHTTTEDSALKKAAAIADLLSIPHHIVDLRDAFNSKIIEPFIDFYRRGLTPNPCIWCNRQIKFGLLLEKARLLGASKLATGHYARICHQGGAYRLLKGMDTVKDQSYFLSTLRQKELKQVLFPLGQLTKKEVCQIAAKKGIPSAKERESQDICFIKEGDYRSFLERKTTFESGDIIDSDNNIFGKHRGLAFYTVGQRHGLGISLAEPVHVIALDAAANRLIVGVKDKLLARGLEAVNLSWVSGRSPSFLAGITAKIRYKAPEVPVNLAIYNNSARIVFAAPLSAVAPGQYAVLYRGEEVLGGGIIEKGIPFS